MHLREKTTYQSGGVLLVLQESETERGADRKHNTTPHWISAGQTFTGTKEIKGHLIARLESRTSHAYPNKLSNLSPKIKLKLSRLHQSLISQSICVQIRPHLNPGTNDLSTGLTGQG